MTATDGSELIEALIAQLRSSQQHLERVLEGGNLAPTDLMKAWPSPDQSWSELLEHLSGSGSLDLSKLQGLLPTPAQLRSLLPDIDAASSWPWPVASTPSPWPAPKRPTDIDTADAPQKAAPSQLRRRRGPGATPTSEPARPPAPRRGSAYDEPDDATPTRRARPARQTAAAAITPGLRRAPRSALTDAPLVAPMVASSERVTDVFEAHDRLDDRTRNARKIETGHHLQDRDDLDDPGESLELAPSMQDVAMAGDSLYIGPAEVMQKASMTPQTSRQRPRGTRDVAAVTEQLMNGERP